MKIYLLLLSAMVLIIGCSAPRYTYNFDYYNYNAGKKSSAKNIELDTRSLTASTQPQPQILPERAVLPSASEAKRSEPISAKMTKAEKKQFRKEAKKTFKRYAASMKKGDTVKAQSELNELDHDLKLAIIFGAVGLTLSLFAGLSQAFWVLGVIAIVVGVVFLIKWLMRQ